jgi:lipoyl-dependent peroxiredoxin subunit D
MVPRGFGDQVSAINECGLCVDARENVLHEKGVNEETILAAVRIASTIHALAAVFDATLLDEEAAPATA